MNASSLGFHNYCLSDGVSEALLLRLGFHQQESYNVQEGKPVDDSKNVSNESSSKINRLLGGFINYLDAHHSLTQCLAGGRFEIGEVDET